LKWPGQQAATANPKPESPTNPTPKTTLTPQQEIAQLQRQIKTLRARLDVIEDENAKLRESNKSVQDLQKELKRRTFTAKMQAEDLRILKTAAIERDLYKTRSERLQRELTALRAKIPGGDNTGAAPVKTPATKPAGP
jgi:uncharacterized protein (DUF3084 family)